MSRTRFPESVQAECRLNRPALGYNLRSPPMQTIGSGEKFPRPAFPLLRVKHRINRVCSLSFGWDLAPRIRTGTVENLLCFVIDEGDR
jgi:hypothetical protein